MADGVVIQPDSEFIRELTRAGAGDWKACYQCATCSATCELSTENAPLPRRQVMAAQWGDKQAILADPGPWLCFYCGDCSERCPRQANPGETMMALRRYLTTQYDWTGLSRRMYRSAAWEVGILLVVAALVIGLFTIPSGFGFGLLNAAPAARRTVMLEHFAPVAVVHLADRLMALALGLLLLSNAFRMFRLLTRNKGLSLGAYLRLLPGLVPELVLQSRWKKCRDGEAARHWKRHVLLVSGYAVIFTLVVLFLPWFQTADSGLRWTALLGYYATAMLLWSTFSMIADRRAKRSEMHRFSHLSDWLFPILLFLTALTGILLHVVRLADWAMPTYVLYMVHLAIAVPMLVVEVPFGKWAHLLYLPLAITVAAATNSKEETWA